MNRWLLVVSCGAVLASPLRAAELVCAEAVSGSPPAAAKGVVSISRLLRDQRQVRALALFARFADEAPANRTAPEYAPALFDPQQPGSLAHFYHAMSSGQLELDGTVLPKRYASLRPARAYAPTDPGVTSGQYGEFVLEILRQADADVDFSRFDDDGPDGIANSGDDDGVVDYLFVAVLSTPRNFIAGGATGVAGLGLDRPYLSADLGANGEPITVSGVKERGAFVQEGTFSQTAGSMAHEFGHALGLPDLYDMVYVDPSEDSGGVGRWDLMGWGAHGWSGDDGPNPFSAWSLKELGWIGVRNDRLVEVPDSAAGLEVAALYQGGKVFQVPLPTRFRDGQPRGQEYLLLEQRTRGTNYYDRHLPGTGLLVWHVRAYSGNENDEDSKAVDLVCADGLYPESGYRSGAEDNLDFWAHDGEYAAAHGGNLGDATDPFDGVRFVRLDRTSNPPISLGQQLSEASTGPALRLRRQGEAMRVDVEPMRWAGTIDGEVHWSGPVLVDGDVTISPRGRLVVHPDAQVRFAGTDRLHAGSDPGLSELVIQGDFVLLEGFLSRLLFAARGTEPSRALFAARNPGERWYGIRVNQAGPARIEAPEGSYEVRDAVHAIQFPGAPPDPRGQVLTGLRLVDALGVSRTGQGSFSPGEAFQCRVDVGNWSLTRYDKVQAVLRWSNPLLVSTLGAQTGQLRSSAVALSPGQRFTFELPTLSVSPQAQAGEVLEFTVRLNNVAARTPRALGPELRATLTVAAPRPARQIQWAVPGRTIRAQSVQILSDQATPIQARMQGRVAAANLILQSVPELQTVAELPMVRQADQEGLRVFEAVVRPPGPGLYQARLRVRGQGASVNSTPASLYVWVAPAKAGQPALVFLGDAYAAEEKEVLRQVLPGRLAGMGLTPYIVDAAPSEGVFYEALLGQHEAEGEVVVWSGTALDEGAQAVFRRFLDQGGRLLMASSTLAVSENTGEFMRRTVRAFPVAQTALTEVSSAGLLAGGPLQLRLPHASLEVSAPALPILRDAGERAAGVFVDTGTYRLVYLGFDLRGLGPEQLGLLLAGVLPLLQQADRVALEVPGLEVWDHVALSPPGRPLIVRARVPAETRAVELVVASSATRDPELAVPLVRTGAEEFSGTLSLPAQGRQMLWLRVQPTSGQTHLAGQSLQVWPLAVPEGRQVLVFMDALYAPADREEMKADLTAVLETLGRQAQVVELAPPEFSLYTALLRRYQRPDQAVVWLGHYLDPGAQAAFRDFTGLGGRLLMVSSRLHRAPNSSEFLLDVFQASRSPGTWKIGRFQLGGVATTDPLLRYYPLIPTPPAVPALLDRDGGVAGVRLDQGAYRGAYFAFDLKDVPRAARRSLLADNLTFLCQPAAAPVETPGPPGRRTAGDGLLVFQAGPNHPNPCNPQTVIPYSLAATAPVRITVYNSLGQVVRRLVDQVQPPGKYEVVWDGRDGEGQSASSGVYLYRMEAGSFQQTRRLLVLK